MYNAPPFLELILSLKNRVMNSFSVSRPIIIFSGNCMPWQRPRIYYLKCQARELFYLFEKILLKI